MKEVTRGETFRKRNLKESVDFKLIVKVKFFLTKWTEMKFKTFN